MRFLGSAEPVPSKASAQPLSRRSEGNLIRKVKRIAITQTKLDGTEVTNGTEVCVKSLVIRFVKRTEVGGIMLTEYRSKNTSAEGFGRRNEMNYLFIRKIYNRLKKKQREAEVDEIG
ncbi:MAG: hypothetical protein ACTS4V_01175 [Candidatus Hodgkinia cicadicola]